MRKTKTSKRSNMMACCGCGRHKKFVSPDVVSYFCTHCFTMNGNYNRYKKGLPVFKPLENIRVRDVVICVDGKEYTVIGRGESIGEDKYYPVKAKGSKDVIFVGDFLMVRRVKK